MATETATIEFNLSDPDQVGKFVDTLLAKMKKAEQPVKTKIEFDKSESEKSVKGFKDWFEAIKNGDVFKGAENISKVFDEQSNASKKAAAEALSLGKANGVVADSTVKQSITGKEYGMVAFGTIGILAGLTAATWAIATARENDTIKLGEQIDKIGEVTKWHNTLQLAQNGSAEAARALGVAVSDTATRQEVSRAVIAASTSEYMKLGQALNAQVEKSKELKDEQEKNSEYGSKIVMEGLSWLTGPFKILGDAKKYIGELRQFSSEYTKEQTARLQAEWFKQQQIYQAETAKAQVGLQQIQIQREKNLLMDQEYARTMLTFGVQTNLVGKIMSDSEILQEHIRQENALRDRSNQIEEEGRQAAITYQAAIQTGLYGALENEKTKADYFKAEEDRQKKLVDLQKERQAAEQKTAQFAVVTMPMRQNEAVLSKIALDNLQEQLFKAGEFVNTGQEILSNEQKLNMLRQRFSEITEGGTIALANMSSEQRKVADPILQQMAQVSGIIQQTNEQNRQRAISSGQQAAQAEKTRKEAQFQLQLENELNLAHNRGLNLNLRRLDLQREIDRTQASILDIDVSGERVSQRKLDKVKELSDRLEKLKSTQTEINGLNTEFADTFNNILRSQAFGQNIAWLTQELELNKKLGEMEREKSLASIESLMAGSLAMREGTDLTWRQVQALDGSVKIESQLLDLRIKNRDELQAAQTSLAFAVSPAEKQAAMERIGMLETERDKYKDLQAQLKETQRTSEDLSFDRLMKEFNQLDKSSTGVANIGNKVNKGLYDAFGPKNQAAAKDASDLFQTAMGGIEGAFKSNLQAVIEGKSSFGDALASMTKSILMNIGIESAWKAALSFANGLFQTATYQYPQAAASFAAGAAYSGIAAATIGISSAIPTPQAAASPASAPAAVGSSGASGGMSSGIGGEGGSSLVPSGIVTNVYGQFYGKENTQEFVKKVFNEANIRGIRRR